MRQLSVFKKEVEEWRALERRISDVTELVNLTDDDAPLMEELQGEIDSISALLDRKEFQLAFAGEFDSHNAILAVHAGAGGTESQDWAEMLMRMYLRWAEQRGYQAEVLDVSPGDEAGIKSIIIMISGDYAYGYLRSEHGVHRLVRLSPFDADHGRHTSFALVEVMPEAEEDTDLHLNPEDIKVETFRSSGPGGQHMQKTSSAVRLTHVPTGTVVVSQSERSQYQNKDIAMRVLKARLLEHQLEEKAAERARLKGERIEAGWGNQIRSYVLHPYKMVKDHRTGYQSGDPDAVLDGRLDEFINEYLMSSIGKEQ
jgi:peptide chain release factor 2